MIYFFVKDTHYVQCEIHPGTPHNRLTVIQPDGSTALDRDCSDDDLARHWADLQRRLHTAGWSGPFGRDGRM